MAASLGLLAGCTSLAALSAGHVGCPEDEIEISDDEQGFAVRTWTASCRGERYYCSNRAGAAPIIGGNGGTMVTSNIQCAAEAGRSRGEDAIALPRTSGPKPGAVASQPAPDPAPSSGVTRRKSTEGDWRIFGQLTLAPFALELQGAPSKDQQRVWLIVNGRATGLDESCSLKLLIDGEVESLADSKFARRSNEPTWVAPLLLSTLERLATAERAAGRLCEEEFRFDSDAQGVLREYLGRFRDELAWEN